MSRKQARYGQVAVYNADALSLNDGDDVGLQVDNTGALRVSGISGGGGGGGGVQYAEGASPATPTGNATFIKGADGAQHEVSPAYPIYTYEQDLAPATGSISVADSGSTSSTGYLNEPIVSGTPTASSFVMLSFSGENAASFQILGNFVGSLIFERSVDGGSTWRPSTFLSNGIPASSIVSSTATGANGVFFVNAAAATNLRLRATAFTSGSASVRILAGAGVFPLSIVSPILGQYNATPPTIPTSGNSFPIQVDAAGNQKQYQATRMDFINDAVTAYDFGYNVTVISTATTTVIKTGSGVIKNIKVLGGTLGNVTAYDNTAASGTVDIPTATPANGQELLESAAFTTGFTIVTAAATLLVVTWR